MSERRKRVLVLNHFAAPRGEAGGTRHVELFSKLDGWDYLIIASDLNPQTGKRIAAEPGFAVVHVPAYSTNGLRRVFNWAAYAWRAILLGLRQRDVDVVYGSSPHLLAALAAWVIATAKRVPFVMEVRDLWPQVLVDMGTLRTTSPVYRVLAALEGFLYRRAASIVVMAQGTQEVLIERGLARSKIVYIPNGADPEDFVRSSPREVLRERYGFAKCTAIYAGAHGPANGLHLLLDAAVELRSLDLEIVLVGGGVEKPRLVDQARERSLNNVRFMDPVPKAEIPDLLGAADVGLHVLADVELFQTAVSPNKLFDYMAAGLPTITNCPGLVAALVQSARCGVSCEPHGLAHALRHFLMNKVQHESWGESGRRWIAENQSRRAMALRLGSVLREAQSAGRTRTRMAEGE